MIEYNGVEFGGNDIIITTSMSSLPIMGVRALSYTVDQVKSQGYGLGSVGPVNRRYGKKSYSGSITLTMTEVVRLQRDAAALGMSLVDVAPFDIIVLYLSKDKGKIVKDVIQSVEFKNYTKELGAEDEDFEVELELLIGGIIEGV